MHAPAARHDDERIDAVPRSAGLQALKPTRSSRIDLELSATVTYEWKGMTCATLHRSIGYCWGCIAAPCPWLLHHADNTRVCLDPRIRRVLALVDRLDGRRTHKRDRASVYGL